MSNPDQPVPPLPQYGEYAPQQPVPPQYYVPAPPPVLRAPEGTKPYTVWIWLITIAIPILGLVAAIPILSSYGSFLQRMVELSAACPRPCTAGSPGYPDPETIRSAFAAMIPAILIGWGGGLVMGALHVVFAWLDHRELERRGVPKPFHWGWSFFVLAGGGILVYIIGRSVVANRRIGRGLAPIWVTIAIYVLSFILTFVLVIFVIGQAVLRMPGYGTGA